MHIAYLIHDFPVNGLATGGAGNYVANMAQIMQKKGHKVSVITESESAAHINWRGIDIYYIEATRGFRDTGKKMSVLKKVLKNLWRSAWYNQKVKEINKNSSIDIVQCVNTYGIGLFRTKRIPYVIRLSSYPSLWGGAEREQFDFDECLKTRRLDEELQLLAMKKADKVISPSKLVADIVQTRINKKVDVIESPVLIDNIDKLLLKESELEKNQYFVTFGANGNRKSIQMLAQLIDEILDKYTEMRYVVIGKDKLIRYQGKYAMASQVFNEHIVKNKSRFFFMGEISDRERLFSIVKSARLCILPTRIDNLPNTVLEAMALGKIVISSTSENGTSVEQLITDGYNGFLFEVDNMEEMLRKIEYIMNLSVDEKEVIEARAKERVKSLTPEEVYMKMLQIYEETIYDFKSYRTS